MKATSSTANAIYDSASLGPTFGAGYDFNTFGALSSRTGYFNRSSYGAWTHSGTTNYPSAFQATRIWVYYNLDLGNQLSASQVATVNSYIWTKVVTDISSD